MKANDLNAFGVSELTSREKKLTNGGWVMAVLIAEFIGAYILFEWALNPNATAKAMQAGFEDGMKL